MEDKEKERLIFEMNEQKEILQRKIRQAFRGGSVQPIRINEAKLNSFDLLNEFPDFVVNDNYAVSRGNSIVKLYLIRTHSEHVIHGRSSSRLEFYDQFCFCVFPVAADFGRSIIRTESILDKIAELFIPCEHDFDDFPDFSSAYCCFSNHPSLLKENVTAEFTELFMSYEEKIAVEFGYGMCMIIHKEPAKEYERNMEMIDFALKLNALIN